MHRTLIILALAALGVTGTAIGQNAPPAPGVSPHFEAWSAGGHVTDPGHSISASDDPVLYKHAVSGTMADRLPDNHVGVESMNPSINATVLHGCVAQPQNSGMLAHCTSANDFRTLDLCMKAYLYQVSQCVQASAGRVGGRPVAILPGVPTPAGVSVESHAK